MVVYEFMGKGSTAYGPPSIANTRYLLLKEGKRLPSTQVMHLPRSAEERWDELQAPGYELHFDLDAQGAAVMTLRDLEGRVLRSIAASEAVEIASTAPGPALDRLLRS